MVNKPHASEKDFSKAVWVGNAQRGSKEKDMQLIPFLQLRSGVMNLHTPSLWCTEIGVFIYPVLNLCFTGKARF